MARAENPIEKYGMSRYDVANRKPRGQEGTFQNRSGNQARDEAQAAARETAAPTFAELQSQGRARPAMPTSPMANVSQMFTGEPAMAMEQGGAPAPARAAIEQALGPQNSQADDDAGWSTILANLERQFADRRENLDTDLARRGLWSSSGDIGASGMLGRLDADNNRTLASAQLDYRNQREDQRNEILRILAPLLLGR
jgi:hypothetical protein